jgi:GDPmannose 4,6-dehydratase
LLGWTPQITAQEMCIEMVRADLLDARKYALLNKNGFNENMPTE